MIIKDDILLIYKAYFFGRFDLLMYLRYCIPEYFGNQGNGGQGETLNQIVSDMSKSYNVPKYSSMFCQHSRPFPITFEYLILILLELAGWHGPAYIQQSISFPSEPLIWHSWTDYIQQNL